MSARSERGYFSSRHEPPSPDYGNRQGHDNDAPGERLRREHGRLGTGCVELRAGSVDILSPGVPNPDKLRETRQGHVKKVVGRE